MSKFGLGIGVTTIGLTALLAWLDLHWLLVALVPALGIALILMFAEAAPEHVSSAVPEALGQAASRISSSAAAVAIGGASVSYFVDQLAVALKRQVEQAGAIAGRVQSLEQGSAKLSTELAEASSQLEQASVQAQRAADDIAQLQTLRLSLLSGIEDTAGILTELKTSADAIASITTTINNLSEQTNMLALNAAIEAARAGEQGRGFAVVADEVRNLAHKTAEATHGIEQLLEQVADKSNASVAAMQSLTSASEELNASLEQVAGCVVSASDSMTRTRGAMQAVAQSGQDNAADNRGIAENVTSLHSTIEHLDHQLLEASEKVMELSHWTESMFRDLTAFDFSDRHKTVAELAMSTAAAIGRLFESAIARGDISERALFDRNYQPIADTDPVKYATQFDQFTDGVLPALQEPILDQYQWIIYAGAVDDRGYFPTHNKKFSQPLTGNRDHDLVANRTKRIFDDPTGSRCGSNREMFLLQTYKRDTGEVMHDLSAPIMVNGRHWGGFRIGYKAQTQA